MEEENFNKMLKMVQMIQMFEGSEEDKQESQIVRQEDSNFIDDKIESAEIKMLKSAIPYLKYEHQRNLAIFIKFMEMQKIIEYYNTAEVKNLETAGDWRRGMLLSMKPYLEKEKQDMVDMITKVMNIREIFDTFKGEENNEY